jgi:hypothetical protein
MPKQLNIRSDEAYRLAHTISEETKQPVVQVIVSALRDYGAKLPERDGLTPTQRAERDALRAIAREAAKHKLPGATSDHSDMYDEFGLPK